VARQAAKVVRESDVRRVLDRASQYRNPERNIAMVLLSFKAGLRACEIAGLSWTMVLNTNGRIAMHADVSNGIAKYGSGRRIPLHPELRSALTSLYNSQKRPNEGPVIRSERGGHMTARSVVNWFRATYTELGLIGCSSHSGRRTFITRSARAITKTGGSLRDVQELAGHRALSTTERYIQGDRDAQRKLIRLI